MKTTFRFCCSLVILAALGCVSLKSTGPPLEVDKISGIAGFVVDSQTNEQVENALVVLQCRCLEAPRKQFTDEHGNYSFNDLRSDVYIIQVLFDKANVSKVAWFDEDIGLPLNFWIDPQDDTATREVVYYPNDRAY